jgi:hypothetical protein
MSTLVTKLNLLEKAHWMWKQSVRKHKFNLIFINWILIALFNTYMFVNCKIKAFENFQAQNLIKWGNKIHGKLF